MLQFLKNSRKLLNSKTQNICLILGNESCDLDSAVCALSLAYFYHKHPQKLPGNIFKTAPEFLPILNIPKRDYALKTEVCYLLKKYAIKEEMLSFRDELEETFLQHCKFVLVDHHVSPFASNTLAVFDHRPKDETANLPSECFVKLEIVGSCGTLVAEQFLMESYNDDVLPLHLLRSAIVLDTVNFSTDAGRLTAKDVEMCSALEQELPEGFLTKSELFESLVQARADVSQLSALQLLRKDLKLLQKDEICIALPGFPMTVQQFIALPQAEAAIKDFAKEHNSTVILLMGMLVQNETVSRDLGLFVLDSKQKTLACCIVKALLASSTPVLNLEEYNNCNFMQGTFFKQHNIKATRKHMLPIVKNCLEAAN